MECTAGDAPGDWLSFRLRERSMPGAGDGDGCGLLRAAPLRWVLREVRDECSSSDSADGLGYSR